MLFHIDADPIGPLKIVAELPNARLAVLEGLNGIGKTLAVRLLQVCIGSRPYRFGSPAWSSLCKGLGEFAVVASELRGGEAIRWVGDSRDWDIPPDDGLAPPAFREITVNGSPVTIEHVRRLLAVHRVSGDEGIIETLAQQADVGAETVRRWARRHTDQKSGPLARLEAEVAGSIRLLGEWPLDRYRRLATSAEDARLAVIATAKAAEQAQRRRDDLASALGLSHQLSELRQRSPHLAEQLASVDQEIQEVEGRREDLQKQVRDLAGQVAAARPQLKELANARRTVERNRENLSGALSTAAIVAATLGVRPDERAVADLITRVERQVAELNTEIAALDTVPSMRRLLEQLASELTSAETDGLGDQVAVDDPVTEAQLTVTQTRAGMNARRAYLEGRPPPPQAQELSDQLARAMRTLAQARQLRSLLAEADRYRRLVAHNEDRVNRALASINPDAGTQIQTLEASRRAMDDRLLQLAADRASLRQQLGTLGDETTERALTGQLAQALRSVNLTEAELQEALPGAEVAMQQAQVSLAEAREEAASIRRELVLAGVEIRRASGALSGHDRLAWLRSVIPTTSLPTESDTPQQQLATIDAARDRAVAVNDRLGELRAQLGAVESALRGVGRHLRGFDPEAVQYFPEMQSWLGQRFSGWFNNPLVRRELLSDADGDVQVNVDRREVIWSERGNRRTRPLEAFSSGEQAFAYTRARLAVLDDEEEEVRPANRLIVLDEFGAFIAHDRLAGLLGYLRDRARDHPEDQVLVILPLGSDYSELARGAVGRDAERYERLAQEIATRQYAVRILES